MTDLVRHGNKSIKKHNLISRNYLLEFGNFNIVFLLCNCIEFLSKENIWILCMIIIRVRLSYLGFGCEISFSPPYSMLVILYS